MMTPMKGSELIALNCIILDIVPILELYPLRPQLSPGPGQGWRTERWISRERRAWV